VSTVIVSRVDLSEGFEYRTYLSFIDFILFLFSPVALVKKLVLTPFLNVDHVQDLRGWHPPTGEQDREQEGVRSSHRMERVVRHKLNDQLISAGSIVQVRIKARDVLYRVQELQFEDQEKIGLGIISDRTTVQLVLEPLPNKFCAGSKNETGLVKEVSRFVGKCFVLCLVIRQNGAGYPVPRNGRPNNLTYGHVFNTK